MLHIYLYAERSGHHIYGYGSQTGEVAVNLHR